MEKHTRVLALCSGGIDSMVAMAMIPRPKFDIEALTITYGQPAAHAELHSARMICRKLNILHHTWDIGELTTIQLYDERASQSVVTDSGFVPGRNLILLAYAACHAQVRNIPILLIGIHAPPPPVYLDCTKRFARAAESVIQQSSGHKVHQIWTPLINMSKKKVFQMGIGLGLDFSLTWSCLTPIEPAPPWRELTMPEQEQPCGKCTSCRGRRETFEAIGYPDPANKGGE